VLINKRDLKMSNTISNVAPDLIGLDTHLKTPENYLLTKSGVFLKATPPKLLADPIWVSALTVDSQTSLYGVAICWIDLQGTKHKKVFDRALLFEQGNRIITELAGLGLSINHEKPSLLKAYLVESSNINGRIIESSSNLGWFATDKSPNQLTYILPPNKVITAQPQGEIIFKPERHSPTLHTIRPKASLASWQNTVANSCVGNPYLVFSLCAAFVAPLLKFANMDSFGVHLYGTSSRGKTTSAQVVASVYGCGADPADSPDQAYCQRWNSTANAFEGLAAAHNDGVLILDELHTCNAKDFASVIYNLLGGKGKSRLTKDAELKRHASWRVVLFSTGEISTQEKVVESGGQSLAGQRNRLLDIPIGNNDIFTSTQGLDGGDYALRLKRQCSETYGTAGPAFIEWLTSMYCDSPMLSHKVQSKLEALAARLKGKQLMPEQSRALRRLMLVQLAGELAIESGVLPFNKHEVAEALEVIIDAWLSEEQNLPEHIQGAKMIQSFMLKNPARFYDYLDSNSPPYPRDLAGYRNDHCYMFTSAGLAEACKSLSRQNCLRHIKELGYLEHEIGRLDKKVNIIGLERPRLYVIKRELIGHDFIGACGADGALT
jgi:putative DNA primase/helicase